MSDDDLARRIAAGDSKAFDDFIIQAMRELVPKMQRLLPNYQDREDAFQAAALEFDAAVKSGRYDPSRPPKPYLKQIYRRRVLNRLRANQAKQRQLEQLEKEKAVDARSKIHNPAERLERSECRRLLFRAAKTLDPKSLKILYQVKVKRQSTVIIAEQEHVTVRTVQLWIENAIKTLKQDKEYGRCQLIGRAA